MAVVIRNIFIELYHRLAAILAALSNWVEAHRPQLDRFAYCFERFIARLWSAIIRFAFLGIIANILGSLFPGLPEKFPTIFAIFDGGAILADTVLRAIFRSVHYVATGHPIVAVNDFAGTIFSLFHQFMGWMSTL